MGEIEDLVEAPIASESSHAWTKSGAEHAPNPGAFVDHRAMMAELARH
jgi:hypothetical protein